MTKYKLDFQGLPSNGGSRIDEFADRALEAFQSGQSRGEFILAEHERYGHSLSWDKLRLIHDMFERWEAERDACNAIARIEVD